MKDLRQIQKKKGIRLIIFSILLCFFGIIIFSISNEDKTITGMFTKKCSISNTSDLYQCQKQNSYVKINLTKVYSTTYVYQKHDNTVAYYLDIDLDGKSLISLVDKETAEKVLDGKQKYMEGKLIQFEDTHADALLQIKAYYNQQNIEAQYLPIQFSNYDINGEAYAMIFILTLIFIFTIFGIKKAVQLITFKNQFSDKIDEINQELNSTPRYQSKQMTITDHYILINQFFDFKVYKVDSVKWIYQKNTKKYGITVNKSIVLCFENGDNIVLPMKNETGLQELKTDVLMGYTKENQQQYQSIVKQYKLNHKK